MHPIAFFDKKVVQKLEQTSSKVRAVVLLICFAIGIALMGIMRTQMQAPHNAGDIPKNRAAHRPVHDPPRLRGLEHPHQLSAAGKNRWRPFLARRSLRPATCPQSQALLRRFPPVCLLVHRNSHTTDCGVSLCNFKNTLNRHHRFPYFSRKS